MKKLTTFFYTCLIVSSLFAIVSCKKDKDDDTKPAETSGVHSILPVTSDNSVSKKWTVQSSSENTRTTGTTNYFYSFEFTPYGYYVIIDADSNVYSSTYTFDGNKTITLKDYGTINISSITATGFSFSVYNTELDKTYTVSSQAVALASEIPNSTLQLARSWKLISQKNNGISTDITSIYNQAYVIISKYGTHAVVLKSDAYSIFDMVVPQVWSWKDNTYSNICVGDTAPDCTNPLSIYLSSDNKMTVKYNDGDGDMVEEYEAISK